MEGVREGRRRTDKIPETDWQKIRERDRHRDSEIVTKRRRQ